MTDVLPEQVTYVPFSATNGAQYQEASNSLVLAVGTLEPGEDKVRRYTMIVGLNAPGGVSVNRAYAVGVDPLGGELRAGPAEARVNMVRVEMTSRVRGWVYLDCDNDGEPDGGFDVAGVPGIELILEDGRRTVTDAKGEFLF